MHKPVLLNEIIKVLRPQPGEVFIDGTLGGGGHSEEIVCKISPGGKFIGLDLDSEALRRSQVRLQAIIDENDLELEASLIEGNFKDLPVILEEEGVDGIDGLLLDLGFSSDQVFSGRGFSYQQDEPLIMRYDGDASSFTAARLLNEYDEDSLAEIIRKYGEERFADRIANSIAKKRREESLRTTKQVVEAIREALPDNYESDIHPAKRTFQAIRIFVNKELENLESILDQLYSIIDSGGRVAVISFHSLEDRMVKNKFTELVDEGSAEFVEKLVTPSDQEVKDNPRSRSAKLRCIKFKK